MGYAQALLGRDYRREQESLQRKAKKKGLWGSVGRTLGGIAATALTGGAAAPWAAGLMAGAGTAIGGAIGAGASGVNLKGGTFMQKERAGLEKQLGVFGEANIVGGLKAGLTAGMGQASKLRKAGIKGKGFDFKGSFVGKELQKAKTAKLAKGYASKGWIDPTLQTKVGGAPIVAMDRRVHSTAAKSARIDKTLQNIGPSGGSIPSFKDVRSSTSSGFKFADPSTQPEYGSGGKSLWEKFQTEDWLGRGAKNILGSVGKGAKTIGDYGQAVVGTAQYRIGQGLEEGAKYNQEIPWDVVPREKDISLGGTSGKPIFDWQLGSSGLGSVFGGGK